LETQRINQTATLNFTFYTYRCRQSIVFALNPASKPQRKPNSPLKIEGIEQAKQWKALIGAKGIESKADLARYLGVFRPRVTQVLKRLMNHQHSVTETVDLAPN
jgi:hypothetical protein